MLITDYDTVTQANPTDLMLLDGSRGTKSIRVSDLMSGGSENILPANRDAYFDFLDNVMVGAVDRRTVYRGKKIELPLSDEIKQGIKDGTFKGLFIGDYFEVTYNSIPVRFLIADFDRYLHRPVEGLAAQHHITAIPYNSCFDENTNWCVNNTLSVSDIYSNSEWVTEGFLTNNMKVTDLLFENGFVKIPVNILYPLSIDTIGSEKTLNARSVATDHPFLLNFPSVFSQIAYGSLLRSIPDNVCRSIPIFYLHPESLQFYTANRQNWLNWWMCTPYNSNHMLYVHSAGIDFGNLFVETGLEKCGWRYAINLAA